MVDELGQREECGFAVLHIDLIVDLHRIRERRWEIEARMI